MSNDSGDEPSTKVGMTRPSGPERTLSENGSSKANHVPLIALSGFLGAGKTTLFNNTLSQIGNKRRIGAIVNDFGKIGVDANLISGSYTKPIELSNGCLCCEFDGQGLDAPTKSLLDAGCEAIFIEASGLAEPRSLAMRMFDTISKDHRLEFGGLVYVLDGLNYKLAERDFALNLYEGLEFADLVIITKVNKLNDLRELLDKKRVIFAPDSNVDAELFLDINPENREAPSKCSCDHHDHSHDHHDHGHHDCPHNNIRTRFTTHTDNLPNPIDKKDFTSRVNSLGPKVWRAKGFVRFIGDDTWYVFQKVGDFQTLKPAPTYESCEAFLIVISLS